MEFDVFQIVSQMSEEEYLFFKSKLENVEKIIEQKMELKKYVSEEMLNYERFLSSIVREYEEKNKVKRKELK